MTISATEYFRTRKEDRKKEPRYLAVINRDSCTSCNSCATMCPVDCIYEIPNPLNPSQAFHQIDTSRCIGCQLCYRIPTESSEHYNLEVCPWNAIDMLHNPNVKPTESPLQVYYVGEAAEELPWSKLEEYAYQFFIDGVVFLPAGLTEVRELFENLRRPHWFYDEGETVSLIEQVDENEDHVLYRATPQGRDVLDLVFEDYGKIFMD